MTLTFEPATQAEAPVVRKLQAQARLWLATRGTNQWQSESLRNPRRTEDRGLVPSIDRGEVYLVRDNSRNVGTVTLDDYADPDFWTEDDQPGAALYVHRMIVDRNFSGHDLGGKMLNWAATKTVDAGKEWLRLDAWRTNNALHAYYQRHGFTMVRVVELSYRGSGALFQRRVDQHQEPAQR